MQREFDELRFFAEMKRKPGLYIGAKSLRSLRDYLFGMHHALVYCNQPEALKYFHSFIEWYNARLFETDQNGYSCWWNHILYTSGSWDDAAFDSFYIEFERYLQDEHGVCLPQVV